MLENTVYFSILKEFPVFQQILYANEQGPQFSLTTPCPIGLQVVGIYN